jgi:serine protein kinase
MQKSETNPQSMLSEVLSLKKQEFAEQKSLLSFHEFAEVFFKDPKLHSRNSASYIKDMIDSYGVETVTEGFNPPKRRYKVFETQRNKSKPAIVGQEEAHEQIYRILEQFSRQGKIDKLILLHGPNGSSKSSTAESLASAMEEYSLTDQGPVYFFSWIFPNDKVGNDEPDDIQGSNKKIGFGDSSAQKPSLPSYAHLADNEILCKITSEFRENPLFLLPKSERISIYKKAYAEKVKDPLEESDLPRYLEEGDLSSKNRRIFDSLLSAYQGDVEKVLKHVQVERFFFSARYRTGLATVEPQMSMDAQERQLTMDRNVQNIPTVLQNIRLFTHNRRKNEYQLSEWQSRS